MSAMLRNDGIIVAGTTIRKIADILIEMLVKESKMIDLTDKEKDKKLIAMLKKSTKTGNYEVKLAVENIIKRLEN